MKSKFPKSLKSVYRQEPISAFIFTFGAIELAMGGFSEHWSLMSFGLLFVITGLMMRWLQTQKPQKKIPRNTPRRYLPESDRTFAEPLPVLRRKKDYREY
ncbi:hypothetical protein A5482_012570 [Cyanobacterium sp. IPPAS B-1200]|uniref:hypothetical protein n=1 Tax=Cyanobacterium sp. IPPAS B-1200 TaxID=1562720 RepID=UPI000852800D|nr:hypothetical protein [Cyanobacterium sp. IPPAS B-1200]OEJ77681.1 hypothetical protein A5482_05200 [Cyanobacterium sp. IPPAS B-1200]